MATKQDKRIWRTLRKQSMRGNADASTDEFMTKMETSATGLSSEEAAKRLWKLRHNEVASRKKRSKQSSNF